MDYIEVRIKVKEEYLSQVEDCLVINGFNQYVVENPKEFSHMIDNLGDTEWYNREDVSDEWLAQAAAIHESENEGEPIFVVITVYFDEGEVTSNLEQLRDSLCDYSPEITVESHSDDEWKDNWKEFFHPTRISDIFVVCPGWATEDELNNLLREERNNPESPLYSPEIIKIDTGMAFGTGTHETTSLTIKMMEQFMAREDSPYFYKKNKVLDVGIGSGILSIAAAKLGASAILGIDIDEEAVRVSNENIEMNDIPNDCDITVIKGDLTEGVQFEADIIVANLLTDLVIRFTPDAYKHLTDDGLFISSGILKEKQDAVLDVLKSNGFYPMLVKEDGEWCSIAARKTSSR